MATSRPLLRYCAQALAWASKHLTSKYPSWPCLPARLTAIRSVQIEVPFAVSRNFGSFGQVPGAGPAVHAVLLAPLLGAGCVPDKAATGANGGMECTRRAAVRPSPSAASGLRAVPQAPTLQPKPGTRTARALAADSHA